LGDTPHLEVTFRKRIGTLALDVAFQANAPWTVLFGPSGSGKSTILRVIAGLARVDAGEVKIHGNPVLDTARGVWVPPHLHYTRSAAQQAWLLPGLVRHNLFFGAHSKARDEYESQVLSLFHLSELVDAEIRQLSGGERQRVSVARAVIAAIAPVNPLKQSPILLLDEPFSGMDSVLRDELVVALRDLLHKRRVPVVSVTHDVGEAFLLEPDVVKIAEGRIVAQGPVAEVLAEERKRLIGILG
jgi:molybdate transport system ATP-binding protein